MNRSWWWWWATCSFSEMKYNQVKFTVHKIFLQSFGYNNKNRSWNNIKNHKFTSIISCTVNSSRRCEKTKRFDLDWIQSTFLRQTIPMAEKWQKSRQYNPIYTAIAYLFRVECISYHMARIIAANQKAKRNHNEKNKKLPHRIIVKFDCFMSHDSFNLIVMIMEVHSIAATCLPTYAKECPINSCVR